MTNHLITSFGNWIFKGGDFKNPIALNELDGGGNKKHNDGGKWHGGGSDKQLTDT